ncbi:hypothetical protein FSC37_22325 [Piscinibacter aquaticus]|uniref:Prepilin-type N-terminal cleavage/methylation domain-containing protein n=1 Tax=Piscinibacter aquaticus TaxID=392597 RepID=A0A5C6TNX1_9BURK|nr:hypothetical protein FSC37_22325 [Piscinibacter aquaticus]
MKTNILRQRGISLVELAVALAIISPMLIAAWQIFAASHRARLEQGEADLLSRVRSSIVAYLARESKLPCPSPDTDGFGSKDCSLAEGYVPFRDIGVADARAGNIRYTVENGKSLLSSVPPTLQVLRISEGAGKAIVGHDTLPADYSGGRASMVELCAVLGSFLTHSSGLSAFRLEQFQVQSGTTLKTEIPIASILKELGCLPLISSARAIANAEAARKIMRKSIDDRLAEAAIDEKVAIEQTVRSVADTAFQFGRVPLKITKAGLVCYRVINTGLDAIAATVTPEQVLGLAYAVSTCAGRLANVTAAFGWLTTATARLAASAAILGKNIDIVQRSRKELINELKELNYENTLKSVAYSGINGVTYLGVKGE